MSTFNVSVDDHVAVQVGHSFQDLSGVFAGHVLRQRAVRLQLVFHRALWSMKSVVSDLFGMPSNKHLDLSLASDLHTPQACTP